MFHVKHRKETNMCLDIMTVTKQELQSLPHPKSTSDLGVFDSIILVPTDEPHDSGYMCMDFIAVYGTEPRYRLSGWSDVLHLDGIGGYGSFKYVDRLGDYSTRTRIRGVEAKGWIIDCLPCGCLRLFCNSKLFLDLSPLSDCEIYASSRL